MWHPLVSGVICALSPSTKLTLKLSVYASPFFCTIPSPELILWATDCKVLSEPSIIFAVINVDWDLALVDAIILKVILLIVPL